MRCEQFDYGPGNESYLGGCPRSLPPNPTHPVAASVKQRVPSKIHLQGFCPTSAPGAWSLLLADDAENDCGGLSHRSWGKETEVPDRVFITPRNVLGPAVDEFLWGAEMLNCHGRGRCIISGLDSQKKGKDSRGIGTTKPAAYLSIVPPLG